MDQGQFLDAAASLVVAAVSTVAEDEKWTRADFIASVAAFISLLALIASTAAAVYTRTQARVAANKAREEAEAKEPAVEIEIENFDWAGFYDVSLTIRNRIDVPVLCGRLKLKGPRGALMTYRRNAYYYPRQGYSPEIKTMPLARYELATELPLNIIVPAAGALDPDFEDRVDDRRDVSVLVLSSATTASRLTENLELTFDVSRIGAGRPYAKVTVVVGIPSGSEPAAY